MHPLMVLVRGIGGGAITSATGAKARIGGAHRVEYSTYYRTSDGKREVDFIIGDEIAIEVNCAKNITDKHLANLRGLKEEGIFSRYIVVSREDSPRMLDDGILILPWKDFLEKLWNGDIVTKK